MFLPIRGRPGYVTAAVTRWFGLAAAAAAAAGTARGITLPPSNMHSLALFETNGTFKGSLGLLSALIRLKEVVLTCKLQRTECEK